MTSLDSIQAQIKSRPLVLYDGECGFCQFWIQVILDYDKEQKFLFASLQSPWLREILPAGTPLKLETMLLYENGVICDRSTAALRIFSRLGGIFSLLKIFFVVPKSIRDAVYNFIARRRHRLQLGKHCRLLLPEEKKRFLPQTI